MKTYKDEHPKLYWYFCMVTGTIIPTSKGENSSLLWIHSNEVIEDSKFLWMPINKIVSIVTILYGDKSFFGSESDRLYTPYVKSSSIKKYLHCSEGPAVLVYKKRKIIEEHYYVNGEYLGEDLNLYSKEQIQNHMVLS